MSYQVLVIDDDDNNRYALKALLEPENINVLEAADGAEALAILIEKRVDLIIMDVQLPDYNGFQLSKIIGNRKKTMSIPIIMASAVFKAQIFMEQGFEVGAVDYILKPINGQVLLAKIALYQRLQKEKNKIEETLIKKDQEIATLVQAVGEYQFVINKLTDVCESLVEIYNEGLEFSNKHSGAFFSDLAQDVAGQEIENIVEKTRNEAENLQVRVVGKSGKDYEVQSFLLKTTGPTKVAIIVRQT